MNRTKKNARKKKPSSRRRSVVSTQRATKPNLFKNIERSLRERFIGPTQIVTRQRLLDFLSEFLAVEKGGIQLYAGAVERSTDPGIQNTFKEYLDQTKNHARILTDVIERLGGDPLFMSPGAIAQERLSRTMLDLEVPSELRELKDAENLLLAETKDHMDWRFLKKISSQVDGRAQKILRDSVSQVEDEEDDHLEFAKKAVEILSIRVAVDRSYPESSDHLAA